MIRRWISPAFFLMLLLFYNAGLLYLCGAAQENGAAKNGRMLFLAAADKSDASDASAGGEGAAGDTDFAASADTAGEGSAAGDDTAGDDAAGTDAAARTADKTVRVLIKTDGYRGICHSRVKLYAKKGLTIVYTDASGEQRTEEAGKRISLSPDDERFAGGAIAVSQSAGGRVKITSLKRSVGHPSYYGTLYLYPTAEGIVIVNELLLEQYLYGVVPSEMPSSYEKEALKAQAVCARSYTYRQLDTYAYEDYQAHLDDSTSFQVYANSAYANSARQAVDETKGQMAWYNGEVIQAYYYSTSCGKTASAAVWGSGMKKKYPYLKSVAVADDTGDYEKDLPWYRWSARISGTLLSRLVGAYLGKEIGAVTSVDVTKRDAGGAAITLKISSAAGDFTVKTEHEIREALGGSGYRIEKNDGSYAQSMDLLPSAFFTIAADGSDYVISGGGFGHGIGMSQNGANAMAASGKNFTEILQKFYSGVDVY